MKINLSYPNRHRAGWEGYFKIPHESLKRTGLAGFHERTISRTSGLAKDKARWRIINLFMRTCPKGLQQVCILSNPGAWWHFERVVAGRLEDRNQKASFVCCEKDRAAFRLSAVMMATIFCASGAVVRSNTEITSKRRTKILLNCDVFDYLPNHRGQKFSCVWLDLTTTITESFGERLKLLAPYLHRDYTMLAITLIRGREQGAVRDAIQSGKSRKRVLETLVQESCGDEFKLADIFNYADGMPMQQIVFLRGASACDNAPAGPIPQIKRGRPFDPSKDGTHFAGAVSARKELAKPTPPAAPTGAKGEL